MRHARGFSLIELMIALVVAGIILAAGMPAFGRYRDSMTLRQANAQLVQDIRRARQLAVTRRAPVVIQFGAPPSTTNITSYEIHVDNNADNADITSTIGRIVKAIVTIAPGFFTSNGGVPPPT